MFSFGLRLSGPFFIIGFYYLIYLHVDAYLFHVMAIVKLRIGAAFGLTWTAVGVVLGYNVLFNHFMAMMIRAGGPLDLVRIEKLRSDIKKRSCLKELDEDNDRFEGISKEVKQVLKYRNKSVH